MTKKSAVLSEARRYLNYPIMAATAFCSLTISEPVMADDDIRSVYQQIRSADRSESRGSKTFRIELDKDSLEVRVVDNIRDETRTTIPTKKKATKYNIISDSDQSRENAEKIARSIESLIGSGTTERNCWRWADLAYRDAGIDMDERVILYDKHKLWGLEHLDKKQLAELQTGDWLYIHNRNNQDRYGNHSLIFLSWIDQDEKIARIAHNIGRKSSGEWRKGSYGISDFSKNPVVFWSRAKYK